MLATNTSLILNSLKSSNTGFKVWNLHDVSPYGVAESPLSDSKCARFMNIVLIVILSMGISPQPPPPSLYPHTER